MHRRKLLRLSSLGLGAFASQKVFAAKEISAAGNKPLVISTWDAGINANKKAWQILSSGGRALDAVEQGVMVTEDEISCCVGLGANPDREGIVTLDASIMDEHGNAGCVCFLERIKHPISVARRVMEKTPHVMLAGSGAQQFALEQGFNLEPQKLSKGAEEAYKEWLQKSEYKPMPNIENKGAAILQQQSFAGNYNHDTIGMLALDAGGNLSGSCTTSGMAFKMRGRVGDSPIIGSGLFVDNEVGAAVGTGLGEEVMKICGTHTIVELMRSGASPKQACIEAVQRIIKRNTTERIKNIQVGFIAINKQGEYGAYAVQKKFNYALWHAGANNLLIDAEYAIEV
ncbi:MAG TPA: N(4)-(beta-N-acetylglucosaminyl)-L-asparaginase [Chitinophagaceae bacterium]|nr:N(4)-(beta-N-acetylglucosaminyl)-L-asparaginase [Chitinophagaceae bacterium]